MTQCWEDEEMKIDWRDWIKWQLGLRQITLVGMAYFRNR
jgi:hypothetical protein